MTIIPARVGLQQRVFPEYRAPFFNLLAKSCLQGFSLFTGLPREEEAIRTALGLQNADYQQGRNLHISKGNTYFCYQSGLIHWLHRWQPNVLIMEANPRYLATPAAANWMHAHGHPVIAWGLGAPPRGKTETLLRLNFLRLFDAIITYSKNGAEQYAACGINPRKIFVAANSMVSRPTQPAPFKPEEYKDGKACLLFVGRLQERKKLDVLLQACAGLPNQLKPKLVIVGDGPDRARLEELAASVYPETQFAGGKHGVELEPYFNKADLFLLPGTGGLAVQQAMAHALPVIVGQADGTQDELVRPENGWTLPDSDTATVTRTLADALADVKRLRRMGLASYRIVAEEVNIESMVETFAKAIKSVL